MLKIIFVIIGTFIGAGFASGQEIYQFFYSYGINGILGLIISSSLISYVIYKVLNIVKDYKIKSYKDFLEKRSNRNFLNLVINNIINIFTLITFFIMISGFGAYFKEQLGINQLIGSCILAVICFFIFNKNIKGVVKVNEIIIPLISVAIIILGVSILKTSTHLNIMKEKSGWLISSILYARIQ